MTKKKQPEFVDRINNPKKYPYIKNKDGSISTHRMAAEIDEKTGKWIVFPLIQFDGKSLKQFKTVQEAMDNAKTTKNLLEMSSKEKAINYAKDGYKKGTALETFNPLADKANKAKTFIEAVE